jgi:hypothetical protein
MRSSGAPVRCAARVAHVSASHTPLLDALDLRAACFTAYRWRTSESNDEIPYSHHPYAYALSNPVLLSDPTGKYAVNEDGLRESRTCPPGTYADPRTGRCWGSGHGSGGSWGGNGILGAGGVVTAVKVTEYVVAGTKYVVGQTSSKLPIFCEVPILVLTRDQVAEWNRSADEAYQQLGQGQNQPETQPQPQPQPVTPQPTPPVPSPTPEERSPVRVQLQDGSNTYATQRLQDPGGGVTVAHVITALDILHADPTIPKGQQKKADKAYNDAVNWVIKLPPTGVTGLLKKSFPFDKKDSKNNWRFDVDILVGTHLMK